MRSHPSNPAPPRGGKTRKTATPPQAPAAEPLVPDSGWHESSYELMRGVEVIECEWPDTVSGLSGLD